MPGISSSNPIFWGRVPNEGARYVEYTVAQLTYLGVMDRQFGGSLSISVGDAGMSCVQSGRLDNTQNAFAVYLTFQDTNDIVFIPAYSLTTFPIFTGNLTFSVNIYSELLGNSPASTPSWKLRVYNFQQADKIVYNNSYGLTTTGRTGVLGDLTEPNGSTIGAVLAANANTLVLPGDPTRYRFSITLSPAAASTTTALISTIDGTLLGAVVGPGSMYSELQALADCPVTTAAIYVKATAATYCIAAQWCKGGNSL